MLLIELEMGGSRLCLCLCVLAVLGLRECLGQVEGASFHVDLSCHVAGFRILNDHERIICMQSQSANSVI